MTPEETQEFLQELTDRITQPEFCYAHQYQKGDLLIIDDRQSLHKAGFDYDHSQHRRLYRMLVQELSIALSAILTATVRRHDESRCGLPLIECHR